MNLSEFVEETLNEILIGVRAAQKKDGVNLGAAEMYDGAAEQGIFNAGTSGFFSIVRFDVSIAAETKAGGKAGLKVWSVGAEGGTERTAQHTNRVKFSVHLKLPEAMKAPRSSR